MHTFWKLLIATATLYMFHHQFFNCFFFFFFFFFKADDVEKKILQSGILERVDRIIVNTPNCFA